MAGIADFEMFTILLSRPGWLIICCLLNFLLSNSLTLIDPKKRIQRKWTYFSELHQPPRPDIYISARLMVLLSGHPSLKKEGKLLSPNLLKLTARSLPGDFCSLCAFAPLSRCAFAPYLFPPYRNYARKLLTFHIFKHCSSAG